MQGKTQLITTNTRGKNPFFSAGGFTLMEILMAVFIFGIVMVTIFGSFNAIFGNVSEIDKKTSQYEMVQQCLDLISDDLNSVYITHYPLYAPPTDDDKTDLYKVWGEGRNVGNATFSFLSFTSYDHLPLEGNPQKGVARIIYYIQSAGTGAYVLKRADMLYPYVPLEEYDFVQNAMDPVLCKDILSFGIVFVDEKGTEYENWDSESEEFGYGTPRALKIKLTVGVEGQMLSANTTVFLPTFREQKEP